ANGVKHRGNVLVEASRPVLLGAIENCSVVHPASAIEEHVELTRFLDCAAHRRAIGHIEHNGFDLWILRRKILHFREGSARSDHMGPFARESQGNCTTDSLPCSSDERTLTRKPAGHLHHSPDNQRPLYTLDVGFRSWQDRICRRTTGRRELREWAEVRRRKENERDTQAVARGLGSSPRLYQRALEILESQIENGEWPAEATLTETGIAARLGISRAPARRALAELEKTGLIAR